MKHFTLRLLPAGFRFRLLRTNETYLLLEAAPSCKVLREGESKPTYLHHSCHVKPILPGSSQAGQIKAGGVVFARQGHRYSHQGKALISLETGFYVKALFFNDEEPWKDYIKKVFAITLKPEPMSYYHGEIPK